MSVGLTVFFHVYSACLLCRISMAFPESLQPTTLTCVCMCILQHLVCHTLLCSLPSKGYNRASGADFARSQ